MQYIVVFIVFILYLKANPTKALFVEDSFNTTVQDYAFNEPQDDPLLVKVNGRSRTTITIKTPKFDNPYPRSTLLLWEIETSGRVEIFFPVFKLRPRKKGRCTDYVSIEDGGKNQRYCGKEFDGMRYKSTTNQISLKFKSSRKPNNKYVGFNCTISHLRPTCNCGQDTLPVVNTRIVGGARPFPWQAILVDPNGVVNKCGGSVISDRWILTAAHCIKPNGVLLQLNQLQILLGVQCLSQLNSGHIRFNAKTLTPHHSYDPATYYNDIALIELEHSIIHWGEEIRPILIPQGPSGADPYIRVAAIISGHGATKTGGEQTDCIRTAIVPTISNEACQSIYQFLAYTISPGQICASYSQGGAGPCHGDSGSAMVIFSLDLGRYLQFGIVSRSFNGICAEPVIPTIYTRVSAYYDWITFYTGPLGGSSCSCSVP